ncbi:hypothetical protein DFJ74DRAFT_704481 [Hyaloraphidium curvatum]|nr:hypothetical protein DFJ74DRAFT_704481 [Hyaloraphidium curvatum]
METSSARAAPVGAEAITYAGEAALPPPPPPVSNGGYDFQPPAAYPTDQKLPETPYATGTSNGYQAPANGAAPTTQSATNALTQPMPIPGTKVKLPMWAIGLIAVGLIVLFALLCNWIFGWGFWWTLLIILLIAVAIGGLMYYMNAQKKKKAAPTAPVSSYENTAMSAAQQPSTWGTGTANNV